MPLYTNEAKSILDQPEFAHTLDDWVPTRIIATQLNIMQGSWQILPFPSLLKHEITSIINPARKTYDRTLHSGP